MASKRKQLYQRRRLRVRNHLKSNSRGRLRLSVFRSNNNISAQLIDDEQGRTVASASSLEKSLDVDKGGNVNSAGLIGKTLAERASEAGYRVCYFDRGGYRYHGRVKALAEAARAAGLQF